VRPVLIHCSFHKCLTVYFRRVMDAVFNRCLPLGGGYRHFNSDIAAFYEQYRDYRLASVNNQVLDLDRLGDFRMTRFVRDPRDLVVSGYFYHRRGAEPWCTQPKPTDADWAFANGRIPDGLRASGKSFADYLAGLSQEEGLLAELEFRQLHFEAMAAWPAEHPQILRLRYEDFPGHEAAMFDRIFAHYEVSFPVRRLGHYFAQRHSLERRRAKDPHIRNPASGQWREHFTPRVKRAFDEEWGGLVEQLGYGPD
jgi:hypothetical protein